MDVSTAGNGTVEIRLYGKGGGLRKRVTIPSFNRDGLAERIEIRSEAWPSYTLHLRLIEGETIAPEMETVLRFNVINKIVQKIRIE